MSLEEQQIRIAHAVKFYAKRGYKMIDVPWMVSSWIDDITRPFNKEPLTVSNGKRLIASGEQGFLQMISQGNLPQGKWMTLTPCFRDDPDEIGGLHRSKFMKLELINFDFPQFGAREMVDEMIKDAQRYFKLIIDTMITRGDPDVAVTLQSGVLSQRFCQDIVSENGSHELGSYGFRHHPRLGRWVFGTGVAEPRLGIVIGKTTKG